MDVSKLSYEKFKELLIGRFGESKTSISEYFTIKKQREESAEDFIRKMETTGRRLKLTANVRMQAIKQGITNPKMREMMIGEEKVTCKLIQKLKEFESLEKITPHYNQNNGPNKHSYTGSRRLICFRCGMEGHIATKCQRKPSKNVNEVHSKDFDILNKPDTIYINSVICQIVWFLIVYYTS